MFNYYLFLLSFFATNSRKEKKKNRDRKNIDLLKPKTHLLPLPPILLLLQRYLTLSDISISSLHRYVISIDFLFEFPHIFFFSSIPSFLFFFTDRNQRMLLFCSRHNPRGNIIPQIPQNDKVVLTQSFFSKKRFLAFFIFNPLGFEYICKI